jgi:RNA polymerase sigma-70 factor, ECF subfamily
MVSAVTTEVGSDILSARVEPRVSETFDQSYLQRLIAGDPVTESHFIRHFSPLLDIRTRMRLRGREGAEDIRQETLFRVLRYLRQGQTLQNAEKLGAFVYAVSQNVMKEFLRKDSRHVTMGDSEPTLVDDSENLERGLLGRESSYKVRQTLEELPERDQRILKGVFFEEASKDRLCEEFGVDRGYLRVLLHRAKLLFKQRYEASELESGATH